MTEWTNSGCSRSNSRRIARGLRGDGLPDARLAHGGRRRRPGSLDPDQPDRRPREIDNLGAWLTTVVARVCLNMLRARKARHEEFPSRPCSRADHRSPRRDGSRARGPPRRLPRPGAPRAARDARPRRARGVRPARRVRPAVRGDRADRRPLADRDQAAGEPGPAPRPRGRARRRIGTCAPSERSSMRSSPPFAAATSRACSRSSTRMSSCGRTAAHAGWEPPGRSAAPRWWRDRLSRSRCV